MPAVKNVGEPCAGESHARFEVAAGGNQASRASTCRTAQAPLADPTKTYYPDSRIMRRRGWMRALAAVPVSMWSA